MYGFSTFTVEMEFYQITYRWKNPWCLLHKLAHFNLYHPWTSKIKQMEIAVHTCHTLIKNISMVRFLKLGFCDQPLHFLRWWYCSGLIHFPSVFSSVVWESLPFTCSKSLEWLTVRVPCWMFRWHVILQYELYNYSGVRCQIVVHSLDLELSCCCSMDVSTPWPCFGFRGEQ